MSKKKAKKMSSDVAPAETPPPMVERVTDTSPAAESLDDPGLAAAIELQQPPPARASVEPIPDEPAGPSGPAVELPTTIQPRILKKTIDVMANHWPAVASFSTDERELLAEVWALPINDLYQRLWKLLGADADKLGPWGQALAVTAALMLPRLAPKIAGAIGDRFKPDASAAP